MTHKTVIIRPVYRSPFIGKITVNAGWNLVSFPGVLDKTNPVDLLPEDSQIQLPFYKWDPDINNYDIAAEIKLGEGYYVYAIGEETLEFGITFSPSCTTYLKTGWNLIGSVKDKFNINNPQEIPAESIELPIMEGNVEKNVIEPYKAYWVKALNGCTLALGVT